MCIGNADDWAGHRGQYMLCRLVGSTHLGVSTQSSGLVSSGSSISLGGLIDGVKSSKMLPLFFSSPSMRI